ncbi:MAG: cadmium-translocating P-type ATPase [Bacteroidetes bacterium]|nr:MAG: cadmium-translocating P-type ATPase [Bacteroidota bacterium]
MAVSWHFLHDPRVQFILCLPVMAIGIIHFGKSAYHSTRVGAPNMDVLIFLGSFSAFVYSIWGSVVFEGLPEQKNYLFFETAATIITLVLLGNLIEKRAVTRTTTAIEELNKLQPAKVKKVVHNLLTNHTEIQTTELKNIKVGDVIEATTGDSIAVDGTVINGDGEIDESAITGESMPVFKDKDKPVVSGTVVNHGKIHYKATAVGSDTLLAKITQAVKDAQTHKPPIQKFSDKVSLVFVPVVLGLALLTFLLSYFAFGVDATGSLLRSIAVLVISCPCAMGLATPTAVMVGLGRAAQNQILIKGAGTIEELGKVKTVVFDKTGTLTTGRFRIKNFTTYNYADFVAKSVIYSLETVSNHPIAKSIVEDYKDWNWRKMEFMKVEEIKGKGIMAEDATGIVYRLGSRDFVDDNTGEIKHDADIFLSYNKMVVASFDIEDQVRPEAKTVIDFLNSKGIRTLMLSGDNEKKCSFVAERLGLKEFYHSQLPEDKLSKLKELSQQGKLAMVGDGINDAPALTQADIGITLSNATDAARQSANIVLIGNQLDKLVAAYHIGTKTYSTIKQNLLWALAYNVVAIPLAAMGYLSPMLGALSMAFSDVVVIGNSLRLKWRKIG